MIRAVKTRVIRVSKAGSAYLFVIGSITVVLFILLASFRRTTDASKRIFRVKEHMIAKNNLNSCVTFVFHTIKTWPFSRYKQHMDLEKGQLELGKTGSCSYKLRNGEPFVYEFELIAKHEKIKKFALLTIEGESRYEAPRRRPRGGGLGDSKLVIKWKYSLEDLKLSDVQQNSEEDDWASSQD